MTSKRVRVAALWIGGLLLTYALIGFLAVPALVKRQLVGYVERDLGHQLSIGTLRFNPFTLAAELTDVELREASGAPLAGFKRLFVNFEIASLLRRAWTFAAVELTAPSVNLELRPDGNLNFSALLAKLRKTPPEPEAPLPRLEIDRVAIVDGRIDLADLQAGEHARLRLEPIAFDLTELSTLPAESSPYKLTARTVDGETVQWGGEIVLNPVSSTGQLALKGWKLATLTRLLGKRIDLHSASGQIDLTLAYRASYAKGAAAFSVSNAKLAVDGLVLAAADGRRPLVSAKRVELDGGSFDLAQRTVALERIDLSEPAFSLEIDAQGRVNWAALAPHPMEAQGPAPTSPAPVPPAATQPRPGSDTTAPPVTKPPPPWNIRLGQVRAAHVSFALVDVRPGSERTFSLAGVELGLSAGIQASDGSTSATLESVSLDAGDATMVRKSFSTALKGVKLATPRIDWEANAAGTKLRLEGTRISLADYAVTLDDQTWRLDRAAASADVIALDVPTEALRIMQLGLAGIEIRSAALTGRIGDKAQLVETSEVLLAAKSFGLGIADPIDSKASDVTLNFGALKLRDPASGAELARLGKAQVSASSVSSADRRIALESISLADGNIAANIGADGKLSWDAFLSAFAPSPAQAPQPKAARASAALPWNVTAKSVQLRNFAAGYSDQRQSPALALNVVDLNATARNLATNAAAPAAIDLSARIKEGGQLQAVGSVHPQTFATDLKVKLTDLSLLPAQQVLAQHARLKIVSALASVDGRLRYGRPKEAAAKFLFEGEAQLNKVNLEETEPAQPFLAFEAMRASQMKFSLEPNVVDIPDLRVNGLVTKILIAEDQSLNLTQVLRTKAEPGKPASPAAPTEKPAADDAEAPFAVSVARIRLDNSIVEFSDLSLRPQFSTRMHELKGVITGVSTSRDTWARLELDARVDEFGSAQIRGSLNPFRPRAFTSIDMDFRNIEMTSLTPYSAKFAGYRIASGKLSTTLQYRVKNSALQGENKIVIDQLQLGERVESPTALNLPLELAVALLKDENGRIDIGLQVTGSLEDPQFSIAALVWKAIGNLLTRIVTAPFRALARIFGGGGAGAEELGVIEFDPGMDVLRPPEKQKLRTVAEALQKRPQLSLSIKPTYSPGSDRPALQSLAARTAILKRAGIKLEPGESPGPLDYGNARIQRAIEDEFMDRFGMPALRDLRASLAKTAPVPPSEDAKAAPSDGPKPAPARSAAFAAIRLARTMSERLIEAVPMSDGQLAELGTRRGDAIAEELKGPGKVEPARFTTDAARAVDDTEGTIGSQLDLAVAK